MGPQGTHFESLDRELQIIQRTRRRREMKDVIDPARNPDGLAHIPADQFEASVLF